MEGRGKTPAKGASRRGIAFMLLALALLTAMISGCQQKPEKAEKMPITILYENSLNQLKQLVEANCPGIELICEKTPYPTEQMRHLEKGVAPDLLVFPAASALDNQRYLLDISDTHASTAYEGAVMDRTKVQGRTYLLPLPGQYMGYIVNTTLFEQAGLALPADNQALVDSLSAMRQKGIGVGEDGINFTVESSYNANLGMYYVGLMVPDFLGTVEGVNWLAGLWDRQTRFAGNWEGAFALTGKMAQLGVIDPAAITKKRNSIRIPERMGKGTLAVVFSGFNALSEIEAENKKNVQAGIAQPYSYQMLPLLSDEGNQPWVLLSPSAYIGINASISEEKQAACRQVLEILSSTQGQAAVLADLQMGVSYLKGYDAQLDLAAWGLAPYVEAGYVYNVQFPDKLVEYLGSNARQVAGGKLTAAEATAAMDAYYEQGSQDVDYNLSIVGTVKSDLLLTNYDVRLRETALGNLVADSVAEAAGVSIALVNGGGIRGSLYQGLTYGEDLAAVCPFDNQIVVLEVSGQTLWDALENSLSRYTQEFPEGRFLQVSGLRYIFDSRQSVGNRLVEVTLRDGTTLKRDGAYTVAVNDYMAGKQGYAEGNGDGFTMLDVYSSAPAAGASLKRETDLTYRDALAQYFASRRDGVVAAGIEGRITNLANAEEG